MFINKIMFTSVITKEMPMLCYPWLSPPTFLANLSGPEYLVTFHTSNSRLRVISMAVRSMTIIPVTHKSSQNSCATDKPMHAKKPVAQIIATVFGNMLSAPKNIVATVQKKKNNILNINHILIISFRCYEIIPNCSSISHVI